MFAYYLDLAWRSLKRSPGMTALMVLSIGIGVALAMTTWTLERSLSRDPIPQKSAELYVPSIDAWGPTARAKFGDAGSEPPDLLDYATAEALMRDHRAKFQSPIYSISPTVVPQRAGEHPFTAYGYAASSDFFPMADVPFRYGSAWSEADDSARAQVVVISGKLNDKLFGGGDNVGKMVTIEGHDYRVVGILGHWNPQPRYFVVAEASSLSIFPAGVLMPFNTAIAAQVPTSGALNCLTTPPEPGFAGLLHSNCLWLSYMVQLDNAHATREYKSYLEGFARQRFAWPPNVRLRDLMAWMQYQQVVPPGFKILRLVGVGLLIVCLVDTIGLMLAKFLRRSGEIGIRRALGAPRRAVYAQFLTEGALIGAVGGVVGIVLTWLAMLHLRARFPTEWSDVAPHLNAELLVLTLIIAIVATLLAALYPTWRAAHVQPAIQIKTN